MSVRDTYRTVLRRVLYFFPLQLLLLHLKKNHLLLLVWLLLFGFITRTLGVKYGVSNLFLFPEYGGHVSFLSYAMIGFSLGGFITAFNLYTYTMHGYRFPFIATISRPFLKFNINNGIIPSLFILTYLYCAARFQYMQELIPPWRIIWHLVGFACGLLTFLGLAMLYFTRTNTDIIKLLGKEQDFDAPPEPLLDMLAPTQETPPQGRPQRRKATRWLKRQQRSEKWRVETYLGPDLRLMLARSSSHYDQELLRDILWQNHINGSIFEVVLVVSFVALGAFSSSPMFSIPAGASAFLLFTMLLMIYSALFSWLQGWTGTLLIALLMMLNLASHRTDAFLANAQAYGIDYDAPPANYDQPSILALSRDSVAAAADARAVEATLQTWLQRNRAWADSTGKPRMVLINTSGGGLRAMLWTVRCLQSVDSLLDGQLMTRTTFMSGSSGGLIGAAYFRQLYLNDLATGQRQRSGPQVRDEISGDMLNRIGFSFVTNDMFIRYRTVRDGDRSYVRDRGSAFEEGLNANTRGLLDVRLKDLEAPERDAIVPHLVMCPVSINDGRRLIVASRPMAFLSHITPAAPMAQQSEPEAIEFQRLFRDHDPGNLKLTSALRMNASFPYISPVVTLPSTPHMRVTDAGGRDNYGYRATLGFLFTFRRWIAEHTSGIVLIQLRDTQRDLPVHPSNATLLDRLTDPLGSVYDNFVRIQDQDYDLMMQQASGWMPVPMEVVDLQLRRSNGSEQISLSWHLTAVERSRVMRSVGSSGNRASLERLAALLKAPNGRPSGDAVQAPAGGHAPRTAASSRGPAAPHTASP
jgi:hypothetical protein